MRRKRSLAKEGTRRRGRRRRPGTGEGHWSTGGELDILVNNAGVTRDGLIARMSDEDWRVVIETNLSGVFHTCRAAARGMMKRRAARS
jgi:NAD(P)-dependent dehydrogenase (short-subunit alcohol dehydrogenase family)